MSTHFDKDEWTARHKVEVAQPSGKKNGYIARVIEDRKTPGGEPKKSTVYNSELTHHENGIFPTSQTAQNVGERWISAKAQQLERVAELKDQRRDELPDKLAEISRKQGEIAGEIGLLRKADKRLATKHDSLISEARNPVVELHFRPGAQDFSIFDACSYSSGTIDEEGNPTDDPRQEHLFDEDGNPIEREEAPESDENLIEFEGISVKDAKAAIDDCRDLERLEAWEGIEKERKRPRKTVLDAIECARESINEANEEPSSSTDGDGDVDFESNEPVATSRPGIDPSTVKWPDEGKAGGMLPHIGGKRDECCPRCGENVYFKNPNGATPTWACGSCNWSTPYESKAS